MKTIIGVRFRQAGKVYYFDPGENVLERNQHVIVETAKGSRLVRWCCRTGKCRRRRSWRR